MKYIFPDISLVIYLHMCVYADTFIQKNRFTLTNGFVTVFIL